MNDERARQLSAQRDITRLALANLPGFALAESGAIREHGVIDRPTEDVDLFTAYADPFAFGSSVGTLVTALRAAGYQVEHVHRASQYARLQVGGQDGVLVEVDLGVDWRQDGPLPFGLGAVLSLADAVGSKVGALYSVVSPVTTWTSTRSARRGDPQTSS